MWSIRPEVEVNERRQSVHVIGRSNDLLNRCLGSAIEGGGCNRSQIPELTPEMSVPEGTGCSCSRLLVTAQ